MKKLFVMLACLVLLSGPANPILAQDMVDTGGVKSLEERIEHLEEAVSREVEGEKWYERIAVSGLIEIEAGYNKVDVPPAEAETSNDLDLATVELVTDVRIVDHVDGHVMIKYEEDELFIDEGFITLTGTERFPAYLIAGRQYVPFGYFDSHFVTDPNTLLLGETNEGAVVAGYRFGGEMIDVSIGAFNGKIGRAGDDEAVDKLRGPDPGTPLGTARVRRILHIESGVVRCAVRLRHGSRR